MNVPENLKYTEEHEWIKVDQNIATVGVTDYAQGELGDVVFVEMPTLGKSFKKGDVVASIEAVKTVAEVYLPVSGKVVELNDALNDAPESINEDAFGNGWMFKIEMSDPSELDSLMTAERYKDLIE
ncbi:MAG TPA: glycine cleavage system protein GcvH [Candidatus Marinimicrobia bacterium]|nr:MAG: glycine cleavage system protein H [Candidatus Marinimicrobia bacterium CG1_02_48_14]PJA51689.1 MAG: glycine cleavage system protein H [Candidatus Marinimicrobia bacterium CG_4_9_14_3_um_filter_48_9]HCW77094.1 glycine cleavage system protein GcvH [Candidatus Neomarinimicrobiota bacterium]